MRTQTWRLPVILILVAASLLLAVPGVAGAHVKAKYRAEYKAKLTSLNNGFLAFASNYDNMKQGSVDAAETMAPMIGDPDQHEQLVAAENWCLTVYNTNKGKPETWILAYWPRSSTPSRDKAARYFATAAQQRTFKHACDLLKAYGGFLIHARERPPLLVVPPAGLRPAEHRPLGEGHRRRRRGRRDRARGLGQVAGGAARAALARLAPALGGAAAEHRD